MDRDHVLPKMICDGTEDQLDCAERLIGDPLVGDLLSGALVI